MILQNSKKNFFWTGLRIRSAYIEYDSADKISYAEFDLVDLIPHYLRFIYSPTKTPSNKAGEATNYFIEPGWYYQLEEWL
jgi:hypothetical protein